MHKLHYTTRLSTKLAQEREGSVNEEYKDEEEKEYKDEDEEYEDEKVVKKEEKVVEEEEDKGKEIVILSIIGVLYHASTIK